MNSGEKLTINDEALLEIAEQVRARKLLAEVAIEKITSTGDYLAIGGAATQRYHFPRPAQRAHTEDVDETYWTYVLKNGENDGTVPILRAGSVASTAILAALGGNINLLDERRTLGKLLTPPNKFYDGGTFGWEFDRNSGGYILSIHEDLLAATVSNGHDDEDEEIGVVDFIDRGTPIVPIPEEPGHFGLKRVHETAGSLPIRMSDVRRNLAQHTLRLLRYEATSTPSPRLVI